MKLNLFVLLSLLQFIEPLTLPFHNGIYSSANQYTVTIQLGTPPRSFEVQVDTGSIKLAVPCSGCNGCHLAANPLFDTAQSSTYSPVACTEQARNCDQCGITAVGPNKCLLNSSYQDNSVIQGSIVSDVFTIPGLTTPIPTQFGCIHYQNDIMSAPGVDGIWGVGKSSINHNGETMRMDQLITALSNQAGSSQRLLAICLAQQGGLMNIGVVDGSLHTLPAIRFGYDDPDSDNIGKSIGKISIGSFVITQNGSQQMPQIMIDSGSSASILSQNFYTSVVNAVDTFCNGMGNSCLVQSGQTQKCYTFEDHQLAFRQIPPISIDFNGVPVLWHAQEYLLLNNGSSNSYCISFTAASGQEQFVFGDDFMLNKDIVFGQSYMEIYPQSKCSGSVFTYGYGSQRRLLTNQPAEMTQTIQGYLSLILSLLLVSVFSIYKLRQSRMKQQQITIQGEIVDMAN